jgi:hypothetical protein
MDPEQLKSEVVVRRPGEADITIDVLMGDRHTDQLFLSDTAQGFGWDTAVDDFG